MKIYSASNKSSTFQKVVISLSKTSIYVILIIYNPKAVYSLKCKEKDTWLKTLTFTPTKNAWLQSRISIQSHTFECMNQVAWHNQKLDFFFKHTKNM